MEKVVDGVYRLGSRWVNFYLVDSGGALTLVDTGSSGYSDQLSRALTEIGRSPNDVQAVVLTHTHTDHVAGGRAFHEATGALVLVAQGEAAIATGEAKPRPPRGFYPQVWRPPLLSFALHAVANQGMKQVTVPELTAFEDGAMLDVPGNPATRWRRSR